MSSFKIVKEKGAFIIAMVKNKGGKGATTIAGQIIDNTKVMAFDMDTNTRTLSQMFPKRIPLVTPDKPGVRVRKGEVVIFDFGGDSDPRMKEVLEKTDLILTPLNPDEVAVKGGAKAVKLVGETNVPVIFILTAIKKSHTQREIDGTLAVAKKLFGTDREFQHHKLMDRKPYTIFGEGKVPLLKRKAKVANNLDPAKKELNELLKKISNYVDLV